ncbi:MAG TPA: long-chain fatty acid--CoA ligase [Spirochaetota bacterium]|nr:MAG: Long-chain-fatty-acid--CoA ligase [Spirochaetes bacterium ADurb.BinA120]HNU90683.1 long-chain fatty acid--CoA ligase [Spirochaetota bacterium]HPI13113.1 long-chain fatty acid--CoA ligase [Spirochaetota bacterium]
MMQDPLLLTNFMNRAARLFSKKEIVSVYGDSTFRYTYGDWYRRTCRLAHALKSLGIGKGDRVASFSLNNHRHLELYFGAPCMGAVLHTLNVRLSQEHLIYIVNHAGDRAIFVDEDLYFLLEPVKDQLKSVEHYVIMSQSGKMPATTLSPVVLYDELIGPFPDEYDFPIDRDENDAALICYTSATTGDPKGVVYSHRGLVLHSLTSSVTLGTRESDCVLHVVPMFHANAWGAPFVAAMMGCKQVLPGRQILDMKALSGIISGEEVTFTCGVPTIWMMLHKYLEEGGEHDFSKLRAAYSGGSAIPRHIMMDMAKKYGFNIVQAYGMTETSPLVTAALPKSYMDNYTEKELYDLKTSAGMLVPCLDMMVKGLDTGVEVAWNGADMGEVCLRGPWIADEYYKDPERSKATFRDGWLHTGDIATIDSEGYIRLVDRTKDLIKSAGEWISSVDLENEIMSHPKVMEAAVIGMPHEKWQERPLACVVPAPDAAGSVTEEEIIDYLKERVAKWWVPDRIVFLEAIPKTSVGKFDKKALRATVLPRIA